ncbi:MAG: hypothetical protein U0800_13315 [Isosphaeraceae bacterium]
MRRGPHGFLDEALRDLADGEGRVIPIRLSLFIEVVEPALGPEPCGAWAAWTGSASFLDDGFGRPEYRQDRDAAQRILERLLPSPTSSIRGNPAGRGELMAASGLADRPGEFDHLMRALAQDLRLIMEADGPGPDEPHYRLARLPGPPCPAVDRARPGRLAGRPRPEAAGVDHGLLAGAARPAPAPLAAGMGQHLTQCPEPGWAPDERA